MRDRARVAAEDVLAGLTLNGRRVLVTGVSSGVGVEIARVLASHGAEVVGTARDLGKATAALAAVGCNGAVELVGSISLPCRASVSAPTRCWRPAGRST